MKVEKRLNSYDLTIEAEKKKRKVYAVVCHYHDSGATHFPYQGIVCAESEEEAIRQVMPTIDDLTAKRAQRRLAWHKRKEVKKRIKAL